MRVLPSYCPSRPSGTVVPRRDPTQHTFAPTSPRLRRYGGISTPRGYPNPAGIRWERPAEKEVRGKWVQPQLFSDGAGSNDAVQGSLGDCWLIGAMSLMATRDDLLDDVFYNWKPTGPSK